MTIVAILSLAAVAAAARSEECITYQCESKGVTWPENTCALMDSKNSTQFSLRACNSQQYCAIDEIGWSSYATCMQDPSPAVYVYPGERCNGLRVCMQGYCDYGYCSILWTTCVEALDCGAGNFCYNGYCLSQRSVGQLCNLDTDCVNNAGCDVAPDRAKGPGRCVQYNTLVPGAPVQNCSGSTTALAPHALCYSGYCFETAIAGAFQCSGLISSPSSPPVRCPTASSTCISNVDSISSLALEQPCQCGFDGYSYCPLFPADPEYMDYLVDVQTYLSANNFFLCNTARHGKQGSSFNVANYFNCEQNLTTAETYHYQRALHYPVVAMAYSCVLKILMPDYYEAEKEVEPSLAHEFLVLGGVLLGGVLIYLLLH